LSLTRRPPCSPLFPSATLFRSVVGLFLIMFALAVASSAPDGVDWEVGDVATRDVVAPRDVVNRHRTEQLREEAARQALREAELEDRKSTRLNSSHVKISYAVCC